LSIFLAVVLVFSVLGINLGIYAAPSYVKAIGAGWFLLTFANIVWLLYFTSEPDSMVLRILDIGASSSHGGNGTPSRRTQRVAASNNGSINNNSSNYQSQSQQSYSNGIVNGNGNGNGNGGLGSTAGTKSVGSLNKQNSAHDLHLNDDNVQHDDFDASNSEYNLKARALYACASFFIFIVFNLHLRLMIDNLRFTNSDNASPDDPNEISFVKGEILSIVDNSGKWWQAKKEDGTKGIIPSNCSFRPLPPFSLFFVN
jgi:SHO1 osmosensor